LNLNEGHITRTDIFNPVKGPRRNIYSASLYQGDEVMIYGYQSLTGKDIPMFLPVPVSLETQSLPGKDDDPFDLMIRFIGQNLITAPGTVIFLHAFPLIGTSGYIDQVIFIPKSTGLL
jgi:hypothetical protein